jgi:hypothetical protein
VLLLGIAAPGLLLLLLLRLRGLLLALYGCGTGWSQLLLQLLRGPRMLRVPTLCGAQRGPVHGLARCVGWGRPS